MASAAPAAPAAVVKPVAPRSPSSFPLGALLNDACGSLSDGPGTPPHPSAPALVQGVPWDTDTDDSSRRTSDSQILPPPEPQPARASSRLGHAQPPSAPVQRLTLAGAAWAVTGTLELARAGSDGGGTTHHHAGRDLRRHAQPAASVLAAAAAAAALPHALLSFPVQCDLDVDALLCDEPPAAPHAPCTSSGGAGAGATDCGGGEGGDSAPAPAGSSRCSSASSSGLSGVQAALRSSLGGLVLQLARPSGGVLGGSNGGGGGGHAVLAGWPAAGGPSLTLAAVRCAAAAWVAYAAALQRTLRGCQRLQERCQHALELLLAGAGLPGCGALACHWLATCTLGVLLLHWRVGLQLLPIAASGLALAALSRMHCGGRGDDDDTCDASAGDGSSHAPAAGASCVVKGRHAGGSLPVWPSALAGAVLAGDCLAVALLACCCQQLGLGSAALHRLLVATPRLLALAALLLGAQLVLAVLCQGWSSASELRRASLVARAWAVAAAGVLAMPGSGSDAGGRAAVMAAAAAWAQKAHLLLEGPALVHHLGQVLLHQQQQQQPPPPQEHGAVLHGDGGSSGALLLCVHCLLQLLVLLFVPPAPLAAVSWLPPPLSGLLVWGARVLLCGCSMQLALRAFGGGGSDSGGSGHAERQPQLGASARSSGDDSCMASPVASPRPRSCDWQLQLRAPSLADGGPGNLGAADSGASGAPGARLAWVAWLTAQHAPYAALLLAAVLGDAFLTAAAAPASVSAPAAWAVRQAWHGCLQHAMVLALCAEAALALRREARLLLQQRWGAGGAWAGAHGLQPSAAAARWRSGA